jgi:hypothetical protein
MSNLGFSMHTDFKAKCEPPRRRVGTGLRDLDFAIETRRRGQLDIVLGLVVICVAIAAMLFPEQAAMLLGQLKALF